MMSQALLREFENPPMIYRGKPFWAWNGRLDPDELRRQVRVMKRMGLGGFFMHSRIGLATKYLSGKWHDCIRACIEEARNTGMEAWLYDEDRWPSGSAGGIVTKDPRYRMLYLGMEEVKRPETFKRNDSTVAVFTARIRGHNATDVKRIPSEERPNIKPGEVILHFSVHEAPKNSWYNGYTYLNTLDHRSVRAFIKSTHDVYRKKFGKDFGGVVPGMFTDEPNHGGYFFSMPWTSLGKSVPWTGKLPKVFRRRYGYDVLDHLPALFVDIDGEGITPARHDYHDCTTFLFSDAYGRQIGEWCDENNMMHTGHVLAEQSPCSQTQVVGSCMRFYEHMQAPGMDLLTQHWREYDTAKQVSSAARQFDKKWRLTETYGCTGWDFSFAGHKAVGDWQAAMGINLRCQHLSWYTMEGTAKRDYPASILHQSPWWEIYSHVEDYFARIHVAMTRGKEIRDLLVIHPVESTWVQCRRDWESEGFDGITQPREFDTIIAELRDSLLAANLDFDYGDEDILARHGRVSTRKKTPEFVVGHARYRAVLVPPLLTIRRTTLRLLKRFHQAGGAVVFAGNVAGYVDAVKSGLAVTLARECTRAPAKGPGLADAMDPHARRISIADDKGKEIVPTLHLLREDRDAMYLFVCNVGHEFPGKADPAVLKRTAVFPNVRIRGFEGCKGRPIELDPTRGGQGGVRARKKGTGWEIQTSLGLVGSRLYLVPKRAGRSGPPAVREPKIARSRTLNAQRWDITLSECNNLVLDRCRYRIGATRWKTADDILRIDRAVRDELGIPHRTWNMVQPWARKRKKNPPSVPLTLKYAFAVDTLPSGDLYLGLESPGLFRASLNGHDIATETDCGWWSDRSLRKVPVSPSILRTGPNELVLECHYNENHPGLEAAFLLGMFGTAVKGKHVTMTSAPASLRIGDWVPQGLAFYSGCVTYRKTVRPSLRGKERLFIHVPSFKGVAVRIWVDGNTAGVIGWDPFELEITEFCNGDPLQLGIEIAGHRRNSHGPLHLNEKETQFYGPDSYTSTGKTWTDDYRLVQVGLMSAPRLVVKK